MVLVCLWLGGCGSRVIARDRPAVIADAGQGWQLVFESSHAAAYAAADRPELDRRNASLNRVNAADRLAAERWPQPTRDSLERARRLFLDDDPRFPTIYLQPRSSRRSY